MLSNWIERQVDKLQVGNELTEWHLAKWYVKYKCGALSCSMFYGSAKGYAAIFDGKVIHFNQLALLPSPNPT
jgi:hypothetical protein